MHHLPDSQERCLALDPHQSFIVQAPAGSGKTALLIQRLLVLLSQVDEPEHILALTFTRKAAHEMRQRLLDALVQAQNLNQEAELSSIQRLAQTVLARSQKRKWAILDNPGRLRIQTLDALCSELARQMPVASRGGAITISDDPFSCYQQAAQRVLLTTAEAYIPSLDQLLQRLDNQVDRAEKCLIDMLSKRDQWLPHVIYAQQSDQTFKHCRSLLETYLQDHIAEHLEHLSSLCQTQTALQALLPLARLAADYLHITDSISPVMACKDLQDWPEANYHALPVWEGLKTLLLTSQGDWRKQVDKRLGFPAASQFKKTEEKTKFAEAKQAILDILEQCHSNTDLAIAFQGLTHLPSPHYAEEDWICLQALISLLPLAVAELQLVFAEQGRVDFIEITQRALSALADREGSPTDLALALDYRIHHILVDEFQDTSISQFRLLEQLMAGWEPKDGRSLFLVGDPMQSIYRFRSAEVGLFLKVQSEGRVAQVPMTSLQLKAQFRAVPSLVTWFNQTFTHLFPKQSNTLFSAVPFTPAWSARADLETDKPTVHWHRIHALEDQGPWIVKLIQSLQQTDPLDKIAILIRAKHHANPILHALAKEQIGYQAVGIHTLFDKWWIKDLFSLTSALLYLADDLSLLACLRAPWTQVSLQGLLTLREIGSDLNLCLWEQLVIACEKEDLALDLSLKDREALARVYRVINDYQLHRCRTSLRLQVHRAWLSLGGTDYLPSSQALKDCHAYFDLLEKFEQAGDLPNIHAFERQLKQHTASILGEQEAKIHIMTIHKSKGLEFDTVILPALEQKSPYDKSSLLLWETYRKPDHDQWLIAPIQAYTEARTSQVYRYLKHQHQQASDLEATRVLYVAATRAKKALHLGYHLPEQGTFSSHSFLGQLAKCYPVDEMKAGVVSIENKQ